MDRRELEPARIKDGQQDLVRRSPSLGTRQKHYRKLKKKVYLLLVKQILNGICGLKGRVAPSFAERSLVFDKNEGDPTVLIFLGY